MSKRDYYEVLSVAKTASDGELKVAFRKLAMQYHPDRNPGDKDAEKRFKEIVGAYEVLKDDQKRAAFDRFGHAAFEQGGFGDGAGAVVARAGEEGGGGGQERGILSVHLRSDGRLGDLLFGDGGPASTPTVGTVKMSGREVFRHAVINLADVALEALEANGLTIGDVDWLVPHQANKRILESTARKLGLPAERVVVTVDRHANTSAASIPLALEEAVGDGRIRPGHLVLMEAMGAGMTWGAGLVRW